MDPPVSGTKTKKIFHPRLRASVQCCPSMVGFRVLMERVADTDTAADLESEQASLIA